MIQNVIKQTLPLIDREEEFQDLLAIAIDYFRRLDREQQEIALKTLLERRSDHLLSQTFDTADSTLICSF